MASQPEVSVAGRQESPGQKAALLAIAIALTDRGSLRTTAEQILRDIRGNNPAPWRLRDADRILWFLAIPLKACDARLQQIEPPPELRPETGVALDDDARQAALQSSICKGDEARRLATSQGQEIISWSPPLDAGKIRALAGEPPEVAHAALEDTVFPPGPN